MGDGEAETRLLIHRCTVVPRSDVVQTGVVHVGDEQWVLGMLTNVLYRGNLPVGNALGCSHGASLALHRLTYRQSNTCAGLGQIFTQHQYRVVAFNFAQRRRVNAAVLQHVQHQVQTTLFRL
ncbi:hypothetical protein D3C72_1575380 [compost metagenome]